MHIFHQWKEIKTQILKNILFGSAGAELPAMRVIERCAKCGKERRIKLNLVMPNKYLRKEYDKLWI